jgi:hypothetical protein
MDKPEKQAWKRTKLIPNSTPVPNFFFDDLLPVLPETTFRVLMFLWRKTIGWNKEKDFVSLSQIQRGTGVCRRHAVAGTRLLEACGLFSRSKSGLRGTICFAVSDFDPHDVVEKLNRLVPKGNQFTTGTSSHQTPELVPQRASTSSRGEHTGSNYPKSNKSKEENTALSILSETLAGKYRGVYGHRPEIKSKILAELTGKHSEEQIVTAWGNFLAEQSDWLIEHRHPFPVFAKQLEGYLEPRTVDSECPAGVQPCPWSTEEGMRRSNALIAAKRKNDEEEAAERKRKKAEEPEFVGF